MGIFRTTTFAPLLAWRNELPPSSDEIEGFLERHISAIVQEPVCVIRPTMDYHVQYRRNRQDIMWVHALQHKDICTIFEFNVFGGNQEFNGVSGNQGKGISLVGLKALLGLAHEKDCNQIRLATVSLTGGMTGPGYWPYLGAMFPEAPLGLSQSILNKKMNYAEFTESEHKKLGRIAEVAELSPHLGMRLLSQMKFQSPKGRDYKTRIFGELKNPGGSMYLLLGEPSTYAILQKHLGILPPFRPIDKTNEHYAISQALAQSRDLALTLQL